MKKIIILALSVLTIGIYAQKASDLVWKSVSDTTTVTNSTAIYFGIKRVPYTVDAVYQIRQKNKSGTTAGYAVLQASFDSINWFPVLGDSVALINTAVDTSIYISNTPEYFPFRRMKIASSGTHVTYIGVNYVWKKQWTAMNKENNLFNYASDLLNSKLSISTDSITLTNTTARTIAMLSGSTYDGMMSVGVYCDTTGTETFGGAVYLEGSIDNKVWSPLATGTLLRSDAMLYFPTVQSIWYYYRLNFVPTGTHKSRVGYQYVTKVK